MESEESQRRRRSQALAAVFVLTAALLAWLWPFGLGDAMPTGGDVTRFQIGLMGHYQDALRDGRLPLWNELWGFGFPGLAESQMGVFYPPHILLYRLLSLEHAYTSSLVLHTLWAGWGTFWLARRLGVSPIGSGIAGWAYATSGFFLIHMSHQWGYSVAAWTPWALGLAWDVGDRRRWSDPIKLAMVLALQMLPGHFQLAFYTQCAVLFIVVWRMTERRREPGAVVGGLARLGAIALAMTMAAAQLIPTYELAKLAESTRDVDYLSQFCASPLHLINFVAPELFHRMPLWRPIAWDPFHTSPEEQLTTIGLVPLFLALSAILGGWRSDRESRLLAALALFALLMSLGPYLPGFSWYCRLPGFSFFRAPARWSVILLLAMAILAGKGWDRLPTWRSVDWELRRFVAVAVCVIVQVIGLYEVALLATDGAGQPGIENLFDQTLESLPWPDDPKVRDLAKIARLPQTDFRAELALAREGFFDRSPKALTWEEQRFVGYRLELTKTAGWLAVLFASSFLLRWPKAFALVLLAVVVGEGMSLRGLRGVEAAPLASLTERSPLLDQWSAMSPGPRILSSDLKNLPMVSGSTTLGAYRTLDLPAQDGLLDLAQGAFSPNESDRQLSSKAIDLLGWVMVVVEPPSVGTPLTIKAADWTRFEDRELANWLYGRAWVDSPRGKHHFDTYYFVADGDPRMGRAWIFDDSASAWSLDSKLSLRERVAGLPDKRALLPDLALMKPDGMSFLIDADSVAKPELAGKPARILISQLYYPRWRAEWTPKFAPGVVGGAGVQALDVQQAAGGWMFVDLPSATPGRLILRYDDGNVWIGIAISAVAWLAASGVWVIVNSMAYIRRNRERGRGQAQVKISGGGA